MLDERPDDLDAMSLFAKVKHMKGELSQAVACWAHIATRSPPPEAALQQLASILQLALDPERGAGEFLALGQLQLVRKPAAYLELEHAFSAFVQRKVDEARSRCEAVARKNQSKDRETYKLAVLAEAWICELSGELEAACDVLERLGTERGFEADTDRVVLLERIYERLGTPDKLEAALHICEFLEGKHHRMSTLSRLAALHRRLGHFEAAIAHEEQYAAAFKTRMHRPTWAEVVAAAAQRYLPLEKLASLKLEDRSLPEELSVRERGINLALTGNLGDAAVAFLETNELIDHKYLADLSALSGNPEAAALLYRDVLERDLTDVRVFQWMLDHHALHGSDVVAPVMKKPAVAAQARELLTQALRAAPQRPSIWRQLATLHTLTGEVTEARRAKERAEALELTARRDERPIGRALAAAVYRFVGSAKGLVHEVWASREVAPAGSGGTLPDGRILGNLPTEMRTAVQSTFLSTREYARSKFPHLTRDILDYTYTYKVTKDDEPSHGLSAGLPTALAFLSVFLQRPLPTSMCSSGVIVADAHDVLSLRSVGDTEHKLKAAYNRNLKQVLLPAANRAELEANGRIPASVREELVAYVPDLDAAVKTVFGEELFLEAGPAPLTLVASA